MNNRLKTLKNRYKKLKEPNNNLNIIDTLDDIRIKISSLLVQHEKYNELKKQKTTNPLLPDVLDNLVYDYKNILESMDIYRENKSILKLRSSLLLNINDLYKDQTIYYKKIKNNNVPSMGELNARFTNLTKFSQTLRAKRTKKR
jgi:hypothetical protein